MARGGLPADRLAPSLENVAVAEAEARAERGAAGPTLPWRDRILSRKPTAPAAKDSSLSAHLVHVNVLIHRRRPGAPAAAVREKRSDEKKGVLLNCRRQLKDRRR
jgi:hypothetical protein